MMGFFNVKKKKAKKRKSRLRTRERGVTLTRESLDASLFTTKRR